MLQQAAVSARPLASAGPQTAAPLAVAGVFTLLLGLGMYVLERDLHALMLVPTSWQWTAAQGTLPAFLVQSGPSFAHVLGFSLISAAFLPPAQRLSSCAAWLLLDGLLECAQHATWQELLTAAGLRGWPAGRFDTQDLLALVLGAAAAQILIVHFSSSKTRTHHD